MVGAPAAPRWRRPKRWVVGPQGASKTLTVSPPARRHQARASLPLGTVPPPILQRVRRAGRFVSWLPLVARARRTACREAAPPAYGRRRLPPPSRTRTRTRLFASAKYLPRRLHTRIWRGGDRVADAVGGGWVQTTGGPPLIEGCGDTQRSDSAAPPSAQAATHTDVGLSPSGDAAWLLGAVVPSAGSPTRPTCAHCADAADLCPLRRARPPTTCALALAAPRCRHTLGTAAPPPHATPAHELQAPRRRPTKHFPPLPTLRLVAPRVHLLHCTNPLWLCSTHARPNATPPPIVSVVDVVCGAHRRRAARSGLL